MGSLALEPTGSFIKSLVATEGYRQLVETGTYLGGTTLWASHLFERVHTVELIPEFQEQAKELCADRANIAFYQGRSEARMPEILAALVGPAIFWLDAHAGGGWFGDKDDCPLLAELALVARRAVTDDFIVVDDARGFLAPPPPPFDAAAWPPIHAVLDAIDPRRERYTVIVNDMIICAPPRLREAVVAFCARARPTI